VGTDRNVNAASSGTEATYRQHSGKSWIEIRARRATRRPANELLRASHVEANFSATGAREAVAVGGSVAAKERSRTADR